MEHIFLSYRRADSGVIAGRIYDNLADTYGSDNIFKDVNNIGPGVDFRDVLIEASSQCTVMLVLIGPSWINVTDIQGHRRLDDAEDFVRMEVETGLENDKVLVVPLLVNGALPPKASELPPTLKELAYRNARVIRDDPDFHRWIS